MRLDQPRANAGLKRRFSFDDGANGHYSVSSWSATGPAAAAGRAVKLARWLADTKKDDDDEEEADNGGDPALLKNRLASTSAGSESSQREMRTDAAGTGTVAATSTCSSSGSALSTVQAKRHRHQSANGNRQNDDDNDPTEDEDATSDEETETAEDDEDSPDGDDAEEDNEAEPSSSTQQRPQRVRRMPVTLEGSLVMLHPVQRRRRASAPVAPPAAQQSANIRSPAAAPRAPAARFESPGAASRSRTNRYASSSPQNAERTAHIVGRRQPVYANPQDGASPRRSSRVGLPPKRIVLDHSNVNGVYPEVDQVIGQPTRRISVAANSKSKPTLENGNDDSADDSENEATSILDADEEDEESDEGSHVDEDETEGEEEDEEDEEEEDDSAPEMDYAALQALKEQYYVTKGLHWDVSRSVSTLFPLTDCQCVRGNHLLAFELDFQLPSELHRVFRPSEPEPLQLDQSDTPSPRTISKQKSSAASYASFTRIRKNAYIDVKRPKLIADNECNCKASAPCTESCLNRLMFVECVRGSCRMEDRCQNRNFQRHNWTKNLKVFQTPNAGYGLRCTDPIAPGQFVMEYVGEVVSDAERERRMWGPYAGNPNHYFLELEKGVLIDACSKGCDARFINHSCDPNCHVEKWNVNGEFRVGIFASRAIAPNEELSYDYRFETLGEIQQQCWCGAANCRKVIGKATPSEKRAARKAKPRIAIDFYNPSRTAPPSAQVLQAPELEQLQRTKLVLMYPLRRVLSQEEASGQSAARKAAEELLLPVNLSYNAVVAGHEMQQQRDLRLDNLLLKRCPNIAAGACAYPLPTSALARFVVSGTVLDRHQAQLLCRIATDLTAMDGLIQRLQTLASPEDNGVLFQARSAMLAPSEYLGRPAVQRRRPFLTLGGALKCWKKFVIDGVFETYDELESSIRGVLQRSIAFLEQAHESGMHGTMDASGSDDEASKLSPFASAQLVRSASDLIEEELAEIRQEFGRSFVEQFVPVPSTAPSIALPPARKPVIITPPKPSIALASPYEVRSPRTPSAGFAANGTGRSSSSASVPRPAHQDMTPPHSQDTRTAKSPQPLVTSGQDNLAQEDESSGSEVEDELDLEDSDAQQVTAMDDTPDLQVNPFDEDVNRCICGVTFDDGIMLECEKCHFWQHEECMNPLKPDGTRRRIRRDEEHLCHLCNPREELTAEVALAYDPKLRRTYFRSMECSTGRLLRMGDAAYVTEYPKPTNRPEGNRNDATHQKRPASKPVLTICRITEMFVDAKMRRFARGMAYVRPESVDADSPQTVHKQELYLTTRTLLFRIGRVRQRRVVVMDPVSYMLGRCRNMLGRKGLLAMEEDTFVCEFFVDSRSTRDRILPLASFDYPLSTNPLHFRAFPEPVPLVRDTNPSSLLLLISARKPLKTGGRHIDTVYKPCQGKSLSSILDQLMIETTGQVAPPLDLHKPFKHMP
ncbi:hypothetical protein CAOG_08491 [Capsaspora owczarzaki ATCC 30864]|uniref:Histone-lysine N-methyltransferase n=1 Tax=Capsaspora owczarzaki (strain ATCC 30864) TaxID=595528 RepID=A0A0D2WIU0_CAPO3|nr:hypothetical protein CAOG_08491 [Capsaspora owczarzaki ATCC 30864]KJE89830.1 hypothetical protein CAOG_008491 [Capsaspora owczarzaki ATCC 30864]|eukprot:XP_011270073.1 hypothetical protein CAOG_08491 [Capsaspora owczarzaki ATCC 30864]